MAAVRQGHLHPEMGGLLIVVKEVPRVEVVSLSFQFVRKSPESGKCERRGGREVGNQAVHLPLRVSLENSWSSEVSLSPAGTFVGRRRMRVSTGSAIFDFDIEMQSRSKLPGTGTGASIIAWN